MFPLVEGAKFIPLALRDEVLDQLAELKTKLDEAIENLIENYEEAKQEQLPVLQKALEQYNQNNPEAATNVEKALQRIQDMYPTPEYIRRKYNLLVNEFNIAPPVNQKAAEILESESESVKDMVFTMVDGLRDELLNKVTQVIESAKKNEVIKSNTLESLGNLCNRLDAMNVLDDSGLKFAVQQLRTICTMEDASTIAQELTIMKKDLEATAEEAHKETVDKLTKLGGTRKLSI
jgi:hypothetical protein